jgi:hypothetical protein
MTEADAQDILLGPPDPAVHLTRRDVIARLCRLTSKVMNDEVPPLRAADRNAVAASPASAAREAVVYRLRQTLRQVLALHPVSRQDPRAERIAGNYTR